MSGLCAVSECGNTRYCKGYCVMHYRRHQVGAPMDAPPHRKVGTSLLTTENLELWTRHQPTGQRVEDKVAYAIEILSLYRPDFLAGE